MNIFNSNLNTSLSFLCISIYEGEMYHDHICHISCKLYYLIFLNNIVIVSLSFISMYNALYKFHTRTQCVTNQSSSSSQSVNTHALVILNYPNYSTIRNSISFAFTTDISCNLHTHMARYRNYQLKCIIKVK